MYQEIQILELLNSNFAITPNTYLNKLMKNLQLEILDFMD